MAERILKWTLGEERKENHVKSEDPFSREPRYITTLTLSAGDVSRDFLIYHNSEETPRVDMAMNMFLDHVHNYLAHGDIWSFATFHLMVSFADLDGENELPKEVRDAWDEMQKLARDLKDVFGEETLEELMHVDPNGKKMRRILEGEPIDKVCTGEKRK